MFKYRAPTRKETKNTNYQNILDMANGQQLSDSQISELLRYFAPKAPKTPKTLFDWVSQAVAKKDVRPYLNYVYSDGERIIGCSGHALLVAPTGQYGKGYYCPKTKQLMEKPRFEYPNIDRVLPRASFDCEHLLDRSNIGFNSEYKIEYITIGEYRYNLTYFKWMDNCPKDHYFCQSDSGQLIVKCYEDSNYVGMVMPLGD
jgi:hypothetical protein